MTTTDTWADLPKWQQLMTTIVGVIWHFRELSHPQLFDLVNRMAMLMRLLHG
jgi:hypothetical protein